ncbi:hypothetical protein J4G37_46525, partial [Microvirga sp. 3-52]|nr:hypothetical protein [Microvirga sp. 3-52]
FFLFHLFDPYDYHLILRQAFIDVWRKLFQLCHHNGFPNNLNLNRLGISILSNKTYTVLYR